MTKLILLLLTLLPLSGCFKLERIIESGDKSTQSLWGNPAAGQPEIDLRSLRLGTRQKLVFELAEGATCTCVIDSGGSADQGTIQASGCTASVAGAGAVCSALSTQFAFQRVSGALRVCSPGQVCENY